MKHITRRQFGICALSAVTAAAVRPAAAAPARRENILIFVADDAGARHFGCYGNPTVRTPHIDRLSANGFTADNAFLTTSQCSPSRISILTGRYPHETGAEDLHMPLPEGQAILPGLLQQAGYFTGHMRKTHYGPHADAQFQWYDEGLERFGDFMDAAGERPFFLWVGFDDPHRPYQDDTIETPHDPEAVELAPWLADTPATRADVARYYDEIARMDGVIGRMMATLERRGLVESTLVVFLSDNGAPFPREKGTLYDAGVRTPLVFHQPGSVPAGTRSDAVVSVIDLAPTCLALAGVRQPRSMRGESLLPALADPTTLTSRAAFSERNWHDTDEHIRSIRTDRYRLIHNAYTERPFGSPADVSESVSWRALYDLKRAGRLSAAQRRLFAVPRPEIEFYDTLEDPWEIDNLAGLPEHKAALREHFALLEAWREETGDFPPTRRRRGDHTDRVTGVHFTTEIPPMTNR